MWVLDAWTGHEGTASVTNVVKIDPQCCWFPVHGIGRLLRELTLLAIATVMLLEPSATARAQSAATTNGAPSYKLFRYDEDYRYLRDPAARTDFWDAIKYIPLSDNTHLSLGGELRERFEYYSAPDFGARGQAADGYLLHRLLLHADLHLGEDFRTFIQLGSHLAPGKDSASAAYVDRADLQQAFVDLRLPIAPAGDIDPTLRAGRQEMVFGSQRLVAIRDAPNVRRNFDGFRIGDAIGGIRIDGFATRPVLLKTGAFDDRPNHDQAFWGVYATVPTPLAPGMTIDLYYLGFKNGRARFGGVPGNEHRHTIGVRLFGAAAGFDWDWEALAQGGAFAGQDVRAWGFATNTGYTFHGAPWSPRLGLKADGASGDHDPGDRTLGTLNPLFPKLAYFNQAALLAPANVLDLQPELTVRPADNLTVTIGWDFLWRETTRDAVYIEPFTPVAATAGRSGHFIGHQVALEAVTRVTRHVEIIASYVHFSVGDTLRAAGGRDVDFAMVSAAYRF